MMRRTAHTTLIAFLVLATALAAQAEQIDGKTALKRMLDAEKKVCFTAHEVTTLARGPAVTSEQTVYRAGIHGLRMEYSSPPPMKGEIRVDDGHVLAHYIPHEKVLRLRPSRLASIHSWLDHSGHGFGKGDPTAIIVGRDKIAGRNAYVLEIRPKVQHGLSRKIWIDTEKWIKLKTEEIAPGGTVMATSYYTKIDFVSSIPDSKFRIDPPPGVRVDREHGSPKTMPIQQVKQKAGFRVVEPSYLPKGFKAVGGIVIPFRSGKIVGLRYTDGVSTVSLFETPGERLSPKFLERLKHGPAHTAEIYAWREGTVSCTIIGRISQDEIRKIAGSVK